MAEQACRGRSDCPPGIDVASSRFETTLCGSVTSRLPTCARCGGGGGNRDSGPSALAFAANIRKHPGLTLVMARAGEGRGVGGVSSEPCATASEAWDGAW